MKERTRLIRVSEAALDLLSEEAHCWYEWGQPVEHVITDDMGKQYYEPVYEPVFHSYNVNDELEPLTLTNTV